MLPNTIRVMNSLDPVPRHPFITGYQGVGTPYYIDKKDGGSPSDGIGIMKIIFGALTSLLHHMPGDYLRSFITAAQWFNAKYPGEERSLIDRVLSAISNLEYPEYSY